MDYRKLAQRHLEEALELGQITLVSGEVRELKSNEILAVARYVLKEGLFSNETKEYSTELPSDIFGVEDED